MRGELIRVTEERDLSRRQMEELSGMHLELQSVVKQKDVAMASLQEMIKKLQMDLRALSGGFLFSCREFRKVRLYSKCYLKIFNVSSKDFKINHLIAKYIKFY